MIKFRHANPDILGSKTWLSSLDQSEPSQRWRRSGEAETRVPASSRHWRKVPGECHKTRHERHSKNPKHSKKYHTNE